MKRKFVFLIFILMLGLFIIPNFKPKAAAYTGGYTVNVYFGTGYLANERVDFYNNSTRISSLNPYINPSTGQAGYYCYTIEEMGWTNHSVNNVTDLFLMGGDNEYSVLIDGELIDFSWGGGKYYKLTSDINLYLNISEKSNNNTIESIPSGYSLTYVIDGVEETVSSLTIVPTLSTPTKEGYIFDGWYYESTFDTKVKEGDSLTADTIIYAKFNQLYDINFVVKYNGVELRQIDPITDVTEIPGNLPNPDEDDYLTFYEFKGWYLDEAFTSGITEGIQLGRDIILYAKLELISYTLSFVSNTDLITLEPVVVTPDTLMAITTLPVLSHDRIDFLGWYYEPIYETEVKETDCLTKDTIIYAKIIKKYLLAYETGLEEFDSYKIDPIYTDKIIIPEWNHPTFGCEGWYHDIDRLNIVNEEEYITEDTIIYAKLLQNSYNISFDSNGGTDVESITSTNIFSELNEPIPYKKGYIFKGWFYDKHSWNEPVIYNDILTLDIILYAKWEKEKYNLQFVTDGSPVEVYNVGYFPNPIPISVKSGYTFDGWYYDDTYTSKVLPGDEINEDINVYAKFRLSYNGVIDDITDGNSISEETLQYIIIFSILGFIVIKILKRR